MLILNKNAENYLNGRPYVRLKYLATRRIPLLCMPCPERIGSLSVNY